MQSKLEKDNVPDSIRWQWALELAQGLAYLHDQGVLHRDLKAENVLLDKNGRAKLADLGVAQVDALVQSTEAYVVAKGMHDLHFIAPENFTVEGQPDNRRISTKATDIYALGLVFWQIVSKGQIPRKERELSFDERTYLYEGRQIEKEQIPNNCPEAFKSLILACWKREPSERPSAQGLVGMLEGLGAEFNLKNHVLIKACNQLEKIIHPKRKEILAYIAPFVTALQVEELIENYWDRWESLKENQDRPNPPLKLEDTFRKFVRTPNSSTLLLLGEAGLGKTLTTYLWADELLKSWWAYVKYPNLPRPPYFPIFIRETVTNWTYTSLQGAFLNTLRQYGLQDANIPILVFIDGYDELQIDESPANLAKHLGLLDYNNAKLIVTCRPKTVDAAQLYGCFNFNGKLQTCHFLPFSIDQLLKYLKEQFSWGEETEAKYKKTLQGSKSVREVLRNPFVLYLLKQSWKTLSQEPLDELTRWKIYEGFVKHSITTKSFLITPQLQDALKASYLSLVDSFQSFAMDIAFRACQNKSMSFNWQEAVAKLHYPWVEFKELVAQDAGNLFDKRQEELSKVSEEEKGQKQRRILLSKKDFIEMMRSRRQQFEADIPIKIRGERYEFSHKSLFEYFVAKRLLQLSDSEADFILEDELQSLMSRLVKSNPEVLLFLHEGWKETKNKELSILPSIADPNKERNSEKVLANAGILLFAVGQVLCEQSNYTEGRECYLRALSIYEKLYNKDHQPIVAAIYNAIGKMLGVQSNCTEAMEYFLQALSIYEKLYDEDHLDVATSYDNIGEALFVLGKNIEALEYRFKALTIREKCSDQPSIAASCNSVGKAMHAQGNYTEALEYYLRALAIYEKLYGKDHSDIAYSYNNIGMILSAQGKYEEALKYYLQALTIYEKLYDKDHPYAAVSYNYIGSILMTQKKYAEAMEYFLKALAIREQVFGKEHPTVANSYNNIGLVFQAQGKYAEAMKYLLKTLAIYEQAYGKEHVAITAPYSSIGRLLKTQGKHTEAMEYFIKALAMNEKSYGKEHPQVAASYEDIGTTLSAQGKHVEAMEYLLMTLAIYEQVYGKAHSTVTTLYAHIGMILYAQGRYEEAKKYSLGALPAFEQVCNKLLSDAISYSEGTESKAQEELLEQVFLMQALSKSRYKRYDYDERPQKCIIL